MRILAVDPGEKRIGVAISDPGNLLARPLIVLAHVSRPVDAATIAALASEQDVGLIIVGQALDADGQVTPQGRSAARLVTALRFQTSIPVILWDEGGSTQAARQVRLRAGARRNKRSGHLDDVAAAVILQSYLDTQSFDDREPGEEVGRL